MNTNMMELNLNEMEKVIGGGVAGGYFGISKIKNWVKEHLPNPNR